MNLEPTGPDPAELRARLERRARLVDAAMARAHALRREAQAEAWAAMVAALRRGLRAARQRVGQGGPVPCPR